MNIVDEIKQNAKDEEQAKAMFGLLSGNRHYRRMVARVNRTAKIPGLQRPFVKPKNSL